MVEFNTEDLKLLSENYAKKDPPITILEHTRELCKATEEFLKFGIPMVNESDRELLFMAVKYHDYGKLNKEFQNLIKGKATSQTLYHHLISPIYFLDREDDFDRLSKLIVVISIIHHHSRQRNLISKNGFNSIIRSLKELNDEGKIIGLSNFDKTLKSYETLLGIYLHNRDPLLDRRIELLSGYLLRIDHSVSGEMPIELPAVRESREKLFLEYVKSDKLNDVQTKIKDIDGSICLIADTGSGKTGAGVIWSKRKMFYVLPVRTSVNAMHKTLSKIYVKKVVGLLHSSALYYLLSEDDNPLMTYDNSRNFAMPVTVTTADQLFVSAYKFPTYEKIYATLAYSDIVVDEVQGFAPEQLVPILHSIKDTQELGARYLIMTATLPGFLKTKLKDIGIDTVESKPDAVKRHLIRLSESKIEELCDEIATKGANSRVLVIVNTVRKAKSLYNLLKKRVNVKLLHSRFILKHRIELENEIINDFQSTEPIIWITTQLVEASLDISYDYLFTEIATIDSLLQRMGRIYRHQKTDYIGDPNIIIALKHDDKVYDKDVVELTIKSILKFDGKYMDAVNKRLIVNEIYSEDNLKRTKYWKRWEETEKRLKNPILKEIVKISGKGDAQDMFRYVSGVNAIPLNIYNSHIKEVEESLKVLKTERDRIKKIKAINYIKNLEVGIPLYFKDTISLLNREHSILCTTLDYQYSEENKEGLVFPEKEFEHIGEIHD